MDFNTILAQQVQDSLMTDNPWVNNGIVGFLTYTLFKMFNWILSASKDQHAKDNEILEKFEKLLQEEKTARETCEKKSARERRDLVTKIEELTAQKEAKSKQYLDLAVDAGRLEAQNAELNRTVNRLESDLEDLKRSRES